MKHANIGIFIPHLACPHTCVFCNQVKISGKGKAPTPSEVREILKKAVKGLKGKKAEIAFFGGSFTAIEKDLMVEYLKVANEFLAYGEITGIRASTRPDAVDEEIIEILKKYNVTDLELGAQSMDDEILAASERGHTAEDTVKASRLLKEAGIRLILQFMPGLPLDTPEKTLETARKILEIKPFGVRIYPTLVIKNTKLETLYNEGKFTPYSLETAVDLTAEMYELFNENGIKVIRMGLHSDISPESIVAGPYHAAFGELVYSEIYRKKIDAIMQKKQTRNPVFEVCPNELSMALGQKKKNLKYIEAKYGALSRIVPIGRDEDNDRIRISPICCK